MGLVVPEDLCSVGERADLETLTGLALQPIEMRQHDIHTERIVLDHSDPDHPGHLSFVQLKPTTRRAT